MITVNLAKFTLNQKSNQFNLMKSHVLLLNIVLQKIDTLRLSDALQLPHEIVCCQGNVIL